jgi:lipopolysaccharide/colanic/teichoic acid biosynthesis glycosyltransferase
MTLVGPRPCSIAVENYELWQTARLEARPGIFGVWQAQGRGRSGFADRCRMDIAQIRETSPLASVALAVRTLLAVAAGKGAT